MSRYISKLPWNEAVDRIIEKSGGENKAFRSWLMTKENLGYPFDYLLLKRCFNIWKEVNSDNDHVTVVCGVEGSGKSFLGANISAMTCPTFSQKHMCYDLHKFIIGLKDCYRGDGFQLDEGAMFLFSREAMGKDNRRAVKLFTLIRQLNLHLVLCVPNFFIIDSYIRDHRVKTLIQVTERGKYTAYTGLAIRLISKYGAKSKQVSSVKVPGGTYWRGYCRNVFPVINDLNEEYYRLMKSEHMGDFLDVLDSETSSSSNGVRLMRMGDFLKLCPMKWETAVKRIRNKDIPGCKIGASWYVNRDYVENLPK